MYGKSPRDWITVYGSERRHPANLRLHWIGLPCMHAGLLLLLWALPVPGIFLEAGPILNWASLWIMAAIVYAFIISPVLALGFAVASALLLWFCAWMAARGAELWPAGIALLFAGWLLVSAGHRAEGNRPSFLGRAQHLPVGLLWLMSRALDRWRVPW
jgi:uncharacterized membrane protein YGL010W